MVPCALCTIAAKLVVTPAVYCVIYMCSTGDILIFMPGQEEIEVTCEVLAGMYAVCVSVHVCWLMPILGLKQMANFTSGYPEHNFSGYPTDSDIIICRRSIILLLPMNMLVLHNTSRHSIHMKIASVVMRIWKQ